MLRSRFLVFVATVILPATALGHNDVSETIEALSAQIAKVPTADLYHQRATEFLALRESAHAIEDLRTALQLEPKNRPVKISLIRALKKSDEALLIAYQLLAAADSPPAALAPAYLAANIHHLRHENEDALTLCTQLQELFPSHSTEIDLLHAEILLDLRQPAKAATILKKSWQRTNSIVLRNNWIDTSLTAGQTHEVLPLINQEVASSRFRSSWLIRRARAALIHDDQKQARSDLQAALTELTGRIRPDQPDLTLIADRGLALALFGRTNAARADHERLKKSILPPSSYRLLTEAL
ncbi:MAG: tetratricopeptide (TPR) repeat protein [Akkermansiaceae bacterium]|jgi:tetratricopeptide (TPR) repeat protein